MGRLALELAPLAEASCRWLPLPHITEYVPAGTHSSSTFFLPLLLLLPFLPLLDDNNDSSLLAGFLGQLQASGLLYSRCYFAAAFALRLSILLRSQAYNYKQEELSGASSGSGLFTPNQDRKWPFKKVSQCVSTHTEAWHFCFDN